MFLPQGLFSLLDFTKSAEGKKEEFVWAPSLGVQSTTVGEAGSRSVRQMVSA